MNAISIGTQVIMPKTGTTPQSAPQQQAKVDPNSPFAKLLELRSLLEEQANKRQ